MKEATGELNMTVIVVIAIAAVAALFYAFIWPAIETSLRNNTCKSLGDGWHAVKSSDDNSVIDANGDQVTYVCCPKDVNDAKDSKCAQP